MDIEEMLRMAPRDLAEHMKTLTADELRRIAHDWNLMPMCSVAAGEAARRYFAGEK